MALEKESSRLCGLESQGNVGRNLHDMKGVFDGGRAGQEKLFAFLDYSIPSMLELKKDTGN